MTCRWKKFYNVFLCYKRDYKADEVSGTQLMKGKPSPNAGNDALGCLRLRWAAAGSGENGSDVDRLERENNRTAARKWFGVICFGSILSTVHVVRATTAVQPFTAELPWNSHRF